MEVRDASVCVAAYLVRADAARAVLAYSRMDVTEVLPGKALCSLVFVRYHDSDLGSYNEFGVTFLVRPDGSGPPPRPGLLAGLKDLRGAGSGTFVHWLPVDQAFTLEAGRAIWGFPKELADVDLRLRSPYKRCLLRRDGRMVVDLLLRPGIAATPVPLLGEALPVPDAYAHLDGVTRRIPWTARPGGALAAGRRAHPPGQPPHRQGAERARPAPAGPDDGHRRARVDDLPGARTGVTPPGHSP